MSIHDSYDIQREGKDAAHWLVRLCDCIFARMDWKQNEYLSTNILIWFWATHWFWIVPLLKIVPDWFVTGCHYSILIALLQIPLIYRHYRHKYLKKHDLPGPFGWGTIDRLHDGCYKSNDIFGL